MHYRYAKSLVMAQPRSTGNAIEIERATFAIIWLNVCSYFAHTFKNCSIVWQAIHLHAGPHVPMVLILGPAICGNQRLVKRHIGNLSPDSPTKASNNG